MADIRTIRNYLIPRIITYFGLIFIGMTVCFIIIHISPVDPVTTLLTRYEIIGQIYDPETYLSLKNSLEDIFGLKGSLWDQYIVFFRRMLSGNFGPSLSSFPTPVNEIIYNSLPWTIGLLSITTFISWVVGNVAGGIAGYFSNKKWTKALESFALIIYPLPYYVMSLLLILLFIYLIPAFPLSGGISIGIKPSLSFGFIFDVIYHAFLPSLSLVISGYGWWFISMRSLTTNVKYEDYVSFCKMIGLKERRILFKYVFRNCMLPQITALSMSLGSIFNGAMATEVIFGYPGIGSLLYKSVLDGDYNLMMGIVSQSIIAIATAVLLLDILYPLIDPRVRYK